MEWSSDTFTEADAGDVLGFFHPEIATPTNVKKLTRYLAEIPPPHDPETYMALCAQIKPTALRIDRGPDAELWLWALTTRALSFEIEGDFFGPMREMLSGGAEKCPADGDSC